jgi:hypothetical protein
MSSDQSHGEEPFERRLEGMYERYRRQYLEAQLTELATVMEETLLQQALAESFFGERIEVDDDVKAAVEETVEKLEAGEFEEVEADIESLSRTVEGAETAVENRIQQLRIDWQDTATAMRRLNERVERVDETQLQSLESLLNEWEWKGEVYNESAETFENRREAATAYGEDMAVIFNQLRERLFGVYDDTELRPLVDKLLDDDRLRLSELENTEREQLADSELADHIELRLS